MSSNESQREKCERLIASFKPEFGNQQHIYLLESMRKLKFLWGRDHHTKSTLEEMDRVEKHVIWMIENKPKDHD